MILHALETDIYFDIYLPGAHLSELFFDAFGGAYRVLKLVKLGVLILVIFW